MLPERVKKLLDSDDIELVQLGANIMKEFLPKEKWNSALEMFSFREQESESNIYVKKFTYKIEKNEITIKRYSLEDSVIGLWSMRQRVNMPLYNLSTFK